MRRSGSSRVPSPTNTTYSGISNYRTDSYRPLKDAPRISSTLVDAPEVARTHFWELNTYLAAYLAKVPFLPVRDDFHPKRNQARQKLATLPTGRFKDLSSDVYYELSRRYPEFKEDPTNGAPIGSPGSSYDDYPSPDFPASARPDNAASSAPPSQDLYNGENRRRPSQDMTGRRSEEYGGALVGRRPSESVSTTSESTSASNAQSAGMGMIIPNKSTIAEEEIEVPYGREVRDSASTAMDDRTRERERERDSDSDVDEDGLRPGGLSGLSARLQAVEGEDEDRAGSRGEDYLDKLSYGRASVTSDRSNGAAGVGARLMGGRASVAAEESERMRRDYEYKIATLQSRVATLEREVEDGREREQKWAEGEARVRAVEEELRDLRQRMEEKTAAMFSLQQELDNSRQERAREKEAEARQARVDEDELRILRDRCEELEAERAGGGQVLLQANPEIMDQLRSDMEGLMMELSDLSRRNDELMTAKDSDLTVIRDLDAQLKEYKRKYEQAKTELRSVKATSQLFLQAPRMDDQLPVSQDGGLVDIHVTAFVSAIDSLLTAGRSNAPTRVLTPMKAVINAVSAIIEDVKIVERRPRRDIDVDALRTLRDRLEATLSNLVAATKTHATGSGMSPVSLLDAAASHVSATVTEIGKAVCIRKATRAEQEQFAPASSVGASATNGYAPPLRSVDEGGSLHQRMASSASSRRGDASQQNGNRYGDDESAGAESPEDAWCELKPYLEAQTDAIVYAIQSVLSGVRSPTPPPSLNENLTQIITIVSSIVAVCKDNIPPKHAQQGGELLRELDEHANRLSETQALPEITKESRQIMAKSSFAIANAMKVLVKLS
ncbi:hypothetical protein POSPLADRAFT_1181965 [Postia placenta MAD-698-R-SB12]|uniref:GIT Spa2 homology (SHD) domain-containing protein n=1 Tax=Postia placenta MAD-698-R-SB12 TaxID=670580 RepID=A0A1X6N0E0_9APHY|nr:hypothetical protein POSPLADRAFT_1181965 [Postia placenta MAD-698-R-SB12]OSX61913.1 hypothetical protein POSPLADRAFT_1181965 [Postia placenta MAD-698-R-SB12]